MGKEWQFESISVDGTGAYRLTYSYSAKELYVMIPDMDTVETAKEAIKAVLNGEDIPKDTESNVSSK